MSDLLPCYNMMRETGALFRHIFQLLWERLNER